MISKTNEEEEKEEKKNIHTYVYFYICRHYSSYPVVVISEKIKNKHTSPATEEEEEKVSCRKNVITLSFTVQNN